MAVTPHLRDGRDPNNMSRVQEDTPVSQTTARGADYRERLSAGTATVGDATAGFGVSKQAITKHVEVLEETGVVTRARRAPRGGRVDGSPAGRLEPFHGRRRRVPEGGRSKVNTPPVVSPEEWKNAREELLVKEKEHTRARDALAAERRRMPWMAVEKEYSFEGPNGPATLADLFEGRRQLIVYRAFYGPEVTTYANPERGDAYPER